ncbi:hypothetical protein C8R43DRAFT_1183811 [Mycena crocata]|nr:hypothetical protein C8R43DRAFT_1183811 [Mycena crocata]
MPAVRANSRRGSGLGRRKSSLAEPIDSTRKAGEVWVHSPTSPNAPVTFAPNVTPVSYTAPSPTPSPYGSPSLTTDLPLPLFPPSATPAPPPTRKRAPPGKRRSQGYIPRPPNAFMLFRADFVRQKHVPGSIETNHGSLSKIIGNCWRALPLPEKHIWETKAKHAKNEHKLKYPDYKFRPVHNKRGANAAASTGQLTPQEDERRCEEVAALLLQGKKGDELASAVRDLDSRRKAELAQSSPSPAPEYASAPYLPNSKFPHPLNLDPMYYPHPTSSPPSSSLTGSHASASSTGSPYSLPMPLQHDGSDRWRHRRSSSVPLPNDYQYTFPPFMYGEGNGMGITLPPLDFPSTSASSFTLPPPPSSGNDSLAALPPSISGAGRMCFSWMGTGPGTGSSFSYPRPSFSFGAHGGSGARGSFSFAGAFGGTWGGNNPIGRRASSAQAFFSPSSFSNYSTSGAEQVQEELPDADTSLFEAGFNLNSFGAAAPASPVGGGEAVSPFDAAEQQSVLHAPQPVHAVSPHGVEFSEQQQHHATYEQEHQTQHYLEDTYAADAASAYSHPSTPASSYPEAEDPASYADVNSYTDTAPASYGDAAEGGAQQQKQQAHHEEAYPPFEFPSHTHFMSDLGRPSIDMSASAAMEMSSSSTPAPYDVEMSAYEDYSREFV